MDESKSLSNSKTSLTIALSHYSDKQEAVTSIGHQNIPETVALDWYDSGQRFAYAFSNAHQTYLELENRFQAQVQNLKSQTYPTGLSQFDGDEYIAAIQAYDTLLVAVQPYIDSLINTITSFPLFCTLGYTVSELKKVPLIESPFPTTYRHYQELTSLYQTAIIQPITDYTNHYVNNPAFLTNEIALLYEQLGSGYARLVSYAEVAKWWLFALVPLNVITLNTNGLVNLQEGYLDQLLTNIGLIGDWGPIIETTHTNLLASLSEHEASTATVAQNCADYLCWLQGTVPRGSWSIIEPTGQTLDLILSIITLIAIVLFLGLILAAHIGGQIIEAVHYRTITQKTNLVVL